MEKMIALEAKKENLDLLMETLLKGLEEAGCPEEAAFAIQLSAEEIFVNIASYAYPRRQGMVVLYISGEEGRMELRFEDTGVAYNPLLKEEPDTELSAEEREPGGLGIFLTRSMMDELTYEYRNGHNCLTMKKLWKKEAL